MTRIMSVHGLAKLGVIGAATFVLSACNSIDLPFGQTAASSANSPDLTRPAAAQSETEGLEIEAPDVFFLEQTGLWDGRPSLGGVWVAHPDVGDPERVIVTNLDNGATVVGALFRRERENHGPEIMVSSDAAAALDVIAGSPTEFRIVALRPQEIPEDLNLAVPPPEPEAASAEGGDAPEFEATALPTEIASATLSEASTAPAATATALDVATLAENAIALSEGPGAPEAPTPVVTATLNAADILADTAAIPASLPADVTPQAPVASAAPAPAPTAGEISATTIEAATIEAATIEPAPIETAALEAVEAAEATPREDLTRPFIQVGVFSAQSNADGVASTLRNGGVIPTVLDQSNAERNLYRVIVGPARNSEDRASLLETVQAMGYEDAYFVTN